MQFIDMSAIQEKKYPVKGAYVIGITSVEDFAKDEYCKFEYDIVEGDLKGYYKELNDSKGFWGASFTKSYKGNAKYYFGLLVKAIQDSNKGFTWDGKTETALKGKVVGVFLNSKEYMKNNGKVGTKLVVEEFFPADDVRTGKWKEYYTIPESIKLATETKAPDVTVDAEEDYPF